MKAVVSLLTFAVLVGYGMILKSAANNGDLWWTLPIGLAFTGLLTWLVWRPADTEGAKEMWANIKAKLGR